MKFLLSKPLRGMAAFIFLWSGSLASSSAATLQFSLVNLSPMDSLALEPVFYLAGAYEISEVVVTSATPGEGVALLPQAVFSFGFDSAGATFPPLGGGEGLPLLLPGDRVDFSLSGVELLAGTVLFQGIGLFSSTPVQDSAAGFMPISLDLTASQLSRFVDSGGGALRLELPDSPVPGPDTISTNTPLLRLTVVPEPSTFLLLLPVLTMMMGRRR